MSLGKTLVAATALFSVSACGQPTESTKSTDAVMLAEPIVATVDYKKHCGEQTNGSVVAVENGERVHILCFGK